MKLQKNTLFALCSVLEAASRPDEALSTAEIARRYGISPHHLAKVLRALARARIVESARGVGGGYRFAGNARRLTLMDVVQLFENIGARERPRGGRRRGGAAAVERALATVLAEIDEIAKATLQSITIATLLKLVARQTGGEAARTRPG